MPDSSRPSRRAAAHSEASPDLEVAAELEPLVRPPVQGEQHVLAGGVEHEAGRREVGRRAGLGHGVRVCREVVEVVVPQPFLPGVGRRPAVSTSTASACRWA